MKYLIILASLFYYGNTFSQSASSGDFVIRCSKVYTRVGGGNEVNYYSALIAKDKVSGYMVYNGKYVYKLQRTSVSDLEYEYKTSKYASVDGDYFTLISITIDRQSLKLYMKYSSYDGSIGHEAINCEQSNFDVKNQIQDIVMQNQKYNDRKKTKEKEAADALDARKKGAKF